MSLCSDLLLHDDDSIVGVHPEVLGVLGAVVVEVRRPVLRHEEVEQLSEVGEAHLQGALLKTFHGLECGELWMS